MDTMFKPIKGVGTHQHFRFSKDSPGTVFVRSEPTSAETAIQLLKQDATVTPDLPAALPKAGLSATRRMYLETSVQQHFTEGSSLPWRHDEEMADVEPELAVTEPSC